MFYCNKNKGDHEWLFMCFEMRFNKWIILHENGFSQLLLRMLKIRLAKSIKNLFQDKILIMIISKS